MCHRKAGHIVRNNWKVISSLIYEGSAKLVLELELGSLIAIAPPFDISVKKYIHLSQTESRLFPSSSFPRNPLALHNVCFSCVFLCCWRLCLSSKTSTSLLPQLRWPWWRSILEHNKKQELFLETAHCNAIDWRMSSKWYRSARWSTAHSCGSQCAPKDPRGGWHRWSGPEEEITRSKLIHHSAWKVLNQAGIWHYRCPAHVAEMKDQKWEIDDFLSSPTGQDTNGDWDSRGYNWKFLLYVQSCTSSRLRLICPT